MLSADRTAVCCAGCGNTPSQHTTASNFSVGDGAVNRSECLWATPTTSHERLLCRTLNMRTG